MDHVILEAGTIVDRYLLVALLGEGGQSQVWEATDPLHPNKNLAIKLLWLDAASPADIERARREAHHLARLTHPTLPSCHALFEDLHHHLLGLVLDRVDGVPLDQAREAPQWNLAYVPLLLLHVIEGLAYLHAEGLVHRDIKPQNILLTADFWNNPSDPSNVRIIDLGISVTHGNPRPLTIAGGLIGTPPFMPPEQMDPAFWHFAGDAPTADVFALGVVAWWLLFQEHPTRISLQESLASFAQAYRTITQEHRLWPPASPRLWTEFFSKTLALSRDQRASSAATLVSLLAPGMLWEGVGKNQKIPTTGPAQSLGDSLAPCSIQTTSPSLSSSRKPLPTTVDDITSGVEGTTVQLLQVHSSPQNPALESSSFAPRRLFLLGIGAILGALLMLFAGLLMRPWLRRRPRRSSRKAGLILGFE